MQVSSWDAPPDCLVSEADDPNSDRCSPLAIRLPSDEEGFAIDIAPVAFKSGTMSDAVLGKGLAGWQLEIHCNDIRMSGTLTRASKGEAGAGSSRHRIGSRSAAADYVRALPDEFAGSMLALFLDGDFNLLGMDRLGEGSVADCGLKPMFIIRRALELGAAGFVLVHHAPGRTSKASAQEYEITRLIQQAGEDFDIHLLDNLIIARDRLIDIVP